MYLATSIMINFYKYFPVSKKDEHWGLNILSVGSTRISVDAVYPAMDHPSHHNFTWENGRILQEYQLVYIVNGGGLIKTESIEDKILDGTVFLVFPNERHRYRPDKDTGWDEYWVSFSGDYMDQLVSKHVFSKKNPLFNLGFNEKILQLFDEIIKSAKEEHIGYQAEFDRGNPFDGNTVHL